MTMNEKAHTHSPVDHGMLLKSDIDTNYPDQAKYEFWGKVPETHDKEVTVSEFQVKSDQTSFLAVNIPINSFEMSVLPCRSLGNF